jgi:hypothetical protein
LLVLAAFAFKSSTPGSEEIPSTAPSAKLAPQVKITGEVACPGTYDLTAVPTIKELLKAAQPLPTGDLSRINLRKKLRPGQTLHIPAKRMIKIQISGAVENPGELEILSGTRLSDLAHELPCLPDADLKSLRKKTRFLQDGDTLEVPFKRKKGEKSKKKKKNLAFLLWKNNRFC